MKNDLILKICNPHSKNRDLLIDELNDEIEENQHSKEETDSIVKNLLEILKKETDSCVQESIFNLLSGVYNSTNSQKEIELYIKKHINLLMPNSIVHALSILSESKLPEREEIYCKLKNHSNPAVRKIAQENLSKLKG
jgi:hypothetical protein